MTAGSNRGAWLAWYVEAGVDEAIDEGLRDAERPWVAEALRELIPKAS